MAKVRFNCYANKSDLTEALRDQDLRGTISFVMDTKEIYLDKDKYCDATSDISSALVNYYTKAEVDQKIGDVRDAAYRVDKLTVDNNVLSIGQVNPAGKRIDGISVSIMPLKQQVVYSQAMVTIEPWNETNIVTTRTDRKRSGVEVVPHVPVVVVSTDASKYPEIKDIKDVDSTKEAICRISTLTFDSAPAAQAWRKFIDENIQSYQSTVPIRPRQNFLARNGAVIDFRGGATTKKNYSFNPVTFFNSDFSSKIYTMYNDQDSTIYTFSFKPEFKLEEPQA